jgi:hypothetical protein
VVFFVAAAGVAVIDLFVEVLFAETVVPTTREEEESIRVVFIVVVVVGLYLSKDIYLSPKERSFFSCFVV